MDARARRELGAAVVLCLTGAAVVLLAAGRPWAVARLDPGAPFPPTTEALPGSAVSAAPAALGLLGLAGVAALLATRRLGRVAVGLVLAGAGAGVVAVAASAGLDGSGAAAALARRGLGPEAVASLETTAWPAVAVAGGALLAAAGLLAAVRGRSWAPLSSRFDRPVRSDGPAAQQGASPGPAAPEPRRRPVDPDAAAWDALDRGEDPTA